MGKLKHAKRYRQKKEKARRQVKEQVSGLEYGGLE